jgi:hypothetical protein
MSVMVDNIIEHMAGRSLIHLYAGDVENAKKSALDFLACWRGDLKFMITSIAKIEYPDNIQNQYFVLYAVSN